MIKWIGFCCAADKPMVAATFTMLRFMASKVAGDGWARDRCRDLLQQCAVKAWRCLAADARHDTFMFYGGTQKIDVQHQTSLGQTM
jgi:hypothetical protein